MTYDPEREFDEHMRTFLEDEITSSEQIDAEMAAGPPSDFEAALVAAASNMLEEQSKGLEVEAVVEDGVVAVRLSDPEREIDLAVAFPNGADVDERLGFMLNLFPQVIQSTLTQMEVQ